LAAAFTEPFNRAGGGSPSPAPWTIMIMVTLILGVLTFLIFVDDGPTRR
jgi:hypothetical protein